MALSMVGFSPLILPHVEEAESREIVLFEQALVQELLFDLSNLQRLHASAVGSEFLSALFAECSEFGFRTSSQQ